MEKIENGFLKRILLYDWKRNYYTHHKEVARSNFTITMGGASITVFVLLLVMFFECLVGYTKLVIPYLLGVPCFFVFFYMSYTFLKKDAGVRTSLLTIYSFAIFIFLYVMAVHDYVNDFQMPHLIPLYMCLVFYPMLIVDTPGRKFIFQVILSVILFLALFYFFDLDPHLAVLTIANVIILASTSYLSACVLLYQRLETYTALKRANYMSRHDMATGLRNRTTFFDDYTKMAQEGIIEGALVIDINDFKHVNDTYGHIVGDKAILYVANILREYHDRETMTFYRYGGDEFVGLFTKGVSQSPDNVAAEIQSRIAEKSLETTDGAHVPITVSVGYAGYEKNDFAERLIARADEKMYENKQVSKNLNK